MNEVKPQTFEEALAALERVVDALEDGNTGLDEALARYEQGVGLLKSCYGKLRQVETRILELTGKDEAGWAQDRRVDFEWQ